MLIEFTKSHGLGNDFVLIDARTDVYALGIILYQLLTGRRPHEGASLFEIQKSILSGSPIHPGKLRQDLPRPLSDLCLRAIERMPDHRPPTARTRVRA